MASLSGRFGNDVIRGTTYADKILGLAGNDTLFGNGGDDYIDGGIGNDKLYGGIGNDKLYGGAGNDVLDGGDGNDWLGDSSGIDTFYGGLGFDTVDYSALIGGRGVNVFLSTGLGGRGAANDHYAGVEGVVGSNFQDFLWGDGNDNMLNGLNGNDFLRGGNGNDMLIGGGGNDELYGDAGNDIFRPGTGKDIVDGGSGNDVADYSDTPGAMTVNVATNTYNGPLAAWGQPDGDIVRGVEVLKATNYDDSIDLTGANIQLGGSSDVFSFTQVDGGGGDDTLSGALRMIGGEGEDSIVLNANLAQTVVLQYDLGYDKIVNFDNASGATKDSLEVSRAAFGIAPGATPDWVDDTNGIDSPDALTTNPTFIYEITTGLLWFDRDGTTGNDAPVAIAGFYGTSNHPLASDLVLVA